MEMVKCGNNFVISVSSFTTFLQLFAKIVAGGLYDANDFFTFIGLFCSISC